MSDSDRSFPPSDHRLAELRRRGIVPYSNDVTSAGALLGAGISIYFFGRDLVRRWSESFNSGSLNACFALLPDAILKIALPIAAGAAFAALIQTRFLIVLAAAGKREKMGLVRFLLGAFKFIAWLGVASLLYFSIVSEFRGGQAGIDIDLLLRGEGAASIIGGASLVNRIVGAASVYFVFLALISWFSSWLAFRRRHSMTRAEVEAEARELEPRPEMRHARAALE